VLLAHKVLKVRLAHKVLKVRLGI
jgi:hypothetical protein